MQCLPVCHWHSGWQSECQPASEAASAQRVTRPGRPVVLLSTTSSLHWQVLVLVVQTSESNGVVRHFGLTFKFKLALVFKLSTPATGSASERSEYY